MTYQNGVGIESWFEVIRHIWVEFNLVGVAVVLYIRRTLLGNARNSLSDVSFNYQRLVLEVTCHSF